MAILHAVLVTVSPNKRPCCDGLLPNDVMKVNSPASAQEMVIPLMKKKSQTLQGVPERIQVFANRTRVESVVL